MMIKSIKLKNIRSYLDEKIEFPDSSVLLSGDVGSGKSTILLAMDFALFGTRRGELDGEALLRHGSEEGSVEMGFEAAGSSVIIKRTLKRKKSIIQDSGVIIIDGVKSELSPNELKAKVFDLLGYPQDILKKNRPIFRFTVYAPQEEMKHILLYPEDRIEILRKIFGIDKYGIIRENAKILITEIRSMKREAESYSRDLEEKINQRQEKEKEKILILDEIKRYEKNLSLIDDKMKSKKAELEAAKEKIEGLIKIRNELMRKESEKSMKEKRLHSIKNEMLDYSKKIEEYENSLKQYGDIEQDIHDLRKIFVVMQKQRDDNIRIRAVLQDEIKKLNDILEKGVCSFCGQEVYDRESFRNNINDKIQKDGEIEGSVELIERDIENCKSRIMSLEKKEHIEKNLSDIRKWRSNREQEMRDTESEIFQLITDIDIIRPRLESFDESEKHAEVIEEEFEKLRREGNEVEKSIARFEQHARNIEELVLILENEISKKKKSREKITYYDELIKWLDEYFINLMGAIEKHVMFNIQQEFNKFFQEWFEILMGDEMDVKINEQFSPIIEQNGFETDYINLSGGEKTSIALAYRLALNKVINIMIDSIKTKDLLILDEPTDGFSSEQLDRMRDVLDKLNLKQVIIVSHEPKIDTFVNNVIKIYKEGHVSKVGA